VPGAREPLDGTLLTPRSQKRDGELLQTDDPADMVVTCANPECSKSLGHQYEGRVFRLRLWPAGAYGGPNYLARYFWLCVSCSSVFTLVFDQRRGVSLARLADADDSENTTNVILEIARKHFRKPDAGRTGNEHELRMGTELNGTEEVDHGRKTNINRKTRSRR